MFSTLISQMATAQHIANREPCPFLPPSHRAIRPINISHIRKRGGQPAYLAALTCAQSLWLQGLPAQSILQLNHSMSHDFGSSELTWPIPYQALVWILTHRYEENFLGNPVRHFQHLATRMSGRNKELRVARAWICFHLSENVLPRDEFPRDIQQIEQEQLVIPSAEETIHKLVSEQEQKIAHQLLS